ncbi:NUDIX hydrolase [Sungkyunkwania multivorans]|uniref:NUDIX hydrolase n=1 Tax=Sungkyunkwania multivorans TaxID=1173618 RepID=A0ABW3CZ16_9FLAO
MKLKKTIHKCRLLAFKEEKILVLQKAGFKKELSLPGGIQKKKETDFHSLIREVDEEIGVLLKKDELSYFVSRKNITKEKTEVYKHYFVATRPLKKITLLEPEKFKRVLWIPWYQALEYMDKEDCSAVAMYCDQFSKAAN